MNVMKTMYAMNARKMRTKQWGDAQRIMKASQEEIVGNLITRRLLWHMVRLFKRNSILKRLKIQDIRENGVVFIPYF